MLFNSYIFLFAFMPALLLVAALAQSRPHYYKLALIGSSLAFYAYSSVSNLFLFLVSVALNFAIAEGMRRSQSSWFRRASLTFGVLLNLSNLFYFKYSRFVFGLFGLSWGTGALHAGFFDIAALPLAISFYTFEQIYFLLETYNGENKFRFLDYFTYITFFPKLIAGPVVRPSYISEQIEKSAQQARTHFDSGLMIFIVALGKKTILADGLVRIIDPVFHDLAVLKAMSGLELWGFALLGALQIYFDYSAYCDMAVGLGLMLGIVLPINFNSPLRTRNFVEFWRCWNITLTHFFTETIFFPLSLHFARRRILGNSAFAQYMVTAVIPIFLTFLAAGIWHGAGINYIYFGVVNAIGLITVQALKKLKVKPLPFYIAYIINMLYAALALLCFRITDIYTLNKILFHMVRISRNFFTWNFSHLKTVSLIILCGYAFALLVPNIMEIFARDIFKLKSKRTKLEQAVAAVYATIPGRIAVAAMGFACIISILNPIFFVYFQF
jgi:alginate O-acetyltransferase complex protein AlgI